MAKPYYLANNETGYGGNYVAGSNRNIHGGVHVFTEPHAARSPATAPAAPTMASPRPVMVMGPGAVVAARLADQGAYDDKAQAFTNNYNGFVLLRHLLQEVPEPTGTPPPPFAIYSLYMHLSYPAADATGGKEYVNVPWARRLLLAQYGVIVDVDAKSPTFGKTLWVTSGTVDKSATDCMVFDEEQRAPVKFEIRKGGAVRGIFKPSPPELMGACKALRAGKIITFDDPYLFVGAGEVVGYLDRPADARPNLPSRFLHWEVFAPAAQNGIKSLLDLRARLAGDSPAFRDVTDSSNDGFLDAQDFTKLVGDALPPAEAETFRDLLPPPASGSSSSGPTEFAGAIHRVVRLGDILPFSLDVPADQPTPLPGGLVYGLDLKITTKSTHFSLPDGSYKLHVVYYDEQGKVLNDASGKPIDESSPAVVTVEVSGDATEVTRRIAVPGAAARIVLSSPDFFVDPGLASSADAEKAEALASFRDAVACRWRDVVLEHTTEWSDAGLQSFFSRIGKAIPYTASDVHALSFWARPQKENDPYGEYPALSRNSVFGTAGRHSLAPDGRVKSLHPTVAVWLIALLQKHGIVQFVREGSAFEGAKNPEVIYCAWATEKAVLKLGDTLHAVAIRKDFDSTADAGFLAWSGDSKLGLGASRYHQGVARLAVSVPFWGRWNLKAASGEPGGPTPLDRAGEWAGNVLKTSPAPTEVEIARPSLQSIGQAVAVPKSREYEVTLHFADHCPRRIGGLVFFQYKTASASGAYELCDHALVVSGTQVSEAETALAYETDEHGHSFIVGYHHRKGKDPRPGSIPFDLWQKACSGTPRISVYLAQALQAMSAKWNETAAAPPRNKVKERSLRPMSKTGLAANGLSVTLEVAISCYHKEDHAAAREVEFAAAVAAAKQVVASTGVVVDDKEHRIKVTVTEPAAIAGDVVLRFDLGLVLNRIAAAARPGAGEKVAVRAGFCSPNGGLLAIAASRADYEPRAAGVVALSAGVKARLQGTGDANTLLKAAPTAEPFLSFDKLEFRGLTYAMGQQAVRVCATAGGPPSTWRNVEAEAVLGALRERCKRGVAGGDTTFTAVIAAKKLLDAKLVGGFVDAKVEVVQGPGSTSGAILQTLMDLEPALVRLAAFDAAHLPASDPDKAAATALFNKYLGSTRLKPEDYVFVLGKAKCMPTDADLELHCVLQPSNKDASKLVRYCHLYGSYGRCDENGYFGAVVALPEVKKLAKDVKKLTFEWKRPYDGKVWGVLVTPRAEGGTPSVPACDYTLPGAPAFGGGAR